MIRRRLGVLTLLACVAAAFTVGCGYSLAGRGSYLPANIRTIGIPTFVNRTSVFNLETQLTEKVRSEFLGRGKYTVVPEATGVDALLTGEVISVTATPAAYTADNLANRYTLRMTARVELRDQRDQTVLWQNPSLVFSQDFDVQTGTAALDPQTFFGQDQNAFDRMTSEFAKSIVSAILEAF
ncbi:MAG TPA: LptE family protein [Vicinamibacterales bacterium]|nr:LptE family protein [Vicinamibacterales bacterium]